jgi:glutathione synthase
MRKDPPYTINYHFATQLLSTLQHTRTLVSNNPSALRDHNEKLFALAFPNCVAPTLVSSQLTQLQQFAQEQGEIVVKPLDAMGGQGIFKIDQSRTNLPVAVEILTENGQLPIMAQKFLPEISAGDKRILMINGEPVPQALARIPQGEDIRGNLAAGGKGVVQPLSASDKQICAEIGPVLASKQIHFAGLDVIGNQVTEINITSPTCIREIERETGLDIAGQLLEVLHTKTLAHQQQHD